MPFASKPYESADLAAARSSRAFSPRRARRSRWTFSAVTAALALCAMSALLTGAALAQATGTGAATPASDPAARPSTSDEVSPTLLQPAQEDAEAERARTIVSPRVPASPAEPRAAKAYAVLDRYCARCHQTGKLEGPAADGRIADILDLAALARDPALVLARNPDGSRLYQSILTHAMPPAGLDSDDGRADKTKEEAAAAPSALELSAVRDWIESLPETAACSAEPPTSPAAAAALMRKALAEAGAGARDLRFVTIGHLVADCRAAQVPAYQQAVARLFNSLSWESSAVQLVALDTAGTILMLRLGDVGWVAAHWETLAQAYPYADVQGLGVPPDIVAMTGSRAPLLGADWLVTAATRPATYYDLLGMPKELEDLEKLLAVDLDDEAAVQSARRVGLRRSPITGTNRLIEFRGRPEGGLWIAHDFINAGGERDLFNRPLARGTTVAGAQPFHADGRRFLFGLPNGLPAAAVYDAMGSRAGRAAAPTPGLDAGYGDAGVGLGCLGCHASGPRRATDDLREAVTGNDGLPSNVRSAVGDLHPKPAELKQLFDEEVFRYRRAKIKAGIDPDLTIDGLDLLTGLARAYERPLTLARAAAEFGLPQAALRARLGEAKGPATVPALRLLLGEPLPRRLAVGLYRGLAEGEPTTGSASRPAAQSHDGLDGPREVARAIPDVAVVADKVVYRVGDLASFRVVSDVDCNLTLINVTPAGKAVVLYPNDFEQNNRLAAGKPLLVPGPGAPYQLRFKEAGMETLVAICPVEAKFPEGIAPDYEQQRFTALGNWRSFLRAVYSGEATKVTKNDPPRRRGRGYRNRTAEAAKSTDARPVDDREGRVAVRIRVE